MRFGLVTYILHKKYEKAFYAYAPYIREMDLWLKIPEKVKIVAPCIQSVPEQIEDNYARQDFDFFKIPSISFTTLTGIFTSFTKLPVIVYEIVKLFWYSDHIHLRCPGNISLVACIVQIFFPRSKNPRNMPEIGIRRQNSRGVIGFKNGF